MTPDSSIIQDTNDSADLLVNSARHVQFQDKEKFAVYWTETNICNEKFFERPLLWIDILMWKIQPAAWDKTVYRSPITMDKTEAFSISSKSVSWLDGGGGWWALRVLR